MNGVPDFNFTHSYSTLMHSSLFSSSPGCHLGLAASGCARAVGLRWRRRPSAQLRPPSLPPQRRCGSRTLSGCLAFNLTYSHLTRAHLCATVPFSGCR